MNLWHLCICSLAEEFWVCPTTFTMNLMKRSLRLITALLREDWCTSTRPWIGDRFWKRWRWEYLLELRESPSYHHGHASPSQVSVGDDVIVHSDSQPRGFWRLRRVEEVLVGKDEKIRGAVLRMAGEGHQAIKPNCYNVQSNYFTRKRFVLHPAILNHLNPNLKIRNNLPMSLFPLTMVKPPVRKVLKKIAAKMNYDAPFIVPDVLLLLKHEIDWWLRLWVRLRMRTCELGWPALWSRG